MKEVKIVSDGHGRRIFVDGQELPNNKPGYVKQQIDKEGVASLVDVDKMIRARQKHQIDNNGIIVGGSFMSQEQKLTLATETKEGEDSRILTAQVNKKMGITD